ncbi:gephyrin-like molybdotransferase Glp [Psychrobacter sanguinis]|uniref:molybdopterin molybdotransferase MoeA n=1 Tax=Psychrobacter sanguinis TaxID=861445 RepID=UPI00020C9405|nr:gephyrin-like molybdotransferase Glp [Psychrobacter sanguinis]EGK13814.1 molybdopterin biosynthesis MoeA protein [Psychrobacter sp. 1501(2011)]MCD9150498.1 molybdopterin molybdotransferase MoeA [Psychrobacter sanguinis]
MITVEVLKGAITERINAYNEQDLPFTKRAIEIRDLLASQNHILATDIVSPFDVPRQDLSAMDGYAIAAGSTLEQGKVIQIIGESQAGSAFTGTLQAGQGVRIFTGAVVPSDCDTVVMQENTNFAEIKDSIDKSQAYDIELIQAAKVDRNIRKQGEEIESGEVILQAGKRLNPADISLLANLGLATVDIYKPLVVGILATGDELVKVGEPLQTLAQIYNSNTPTLKSMFADMPVIIYDYGIIPDHLELTKKAVLSAMQECDVLISTAGVSVGDYDFLTTVIEELGQINHYKVAMKPGKPFVFGELTQGLEVPVLYFGLPGNPLSSVVGSLQFIIPALWQLSGVAQEDMPMILTVTATLSNDVRKSPGRADFQRGILSQDGAGRYVVSTAGKQDSHRIKQLSLANCLIVLPKDSGNVSAGEEVLVQPFPWS